MDGFVFVCVGGIRCVGRALRVRKRRAYMRPRRGMSSLANTETGYHSILFQRSYVLSSSCRTNGPDTINILHSASRRE